MLLQIKKTWDEQPLVLIIGLAIFFRLLAVIFARGWGMFDDHFLVIESAQSWTEGFDVTKWLPWHPANQGPTGHLMIYPGLHYLLFSFLEWIRITDPQAKMYVVRLLHAAFSLLTVIYGYKIADKLDGRRSAKLVGLLLAILWFMPWMSVRNLVEFVCIPFLILGFWQMIREDKPRFPFFTFFLAGIFFGLAVDIRLQSILFIAGTGIVLLFQKRWLALFGLFTGGVITIFLTLGLIDIILWGYPFAEIYGYIAVNIAQRTHYIILPWYNFLLVVLIFLIPPASLFLFFGFLHTWKRYVLLFAPALLFLVFHSIFPNKQERFILPLIPFIIILGVMGWNQFVSRSVFWNNHRKLLRSCWIFFWIINLVMLPAITVHYSKKARAESMYYLSKYPDIKQLLIADTDKRHEAFPLYYLNQWPYTYNEFYSHESTKMLIRRASRAPADEQPRFILFIGIEDLQKRVIKTRENFPYIVYETVIEPGFIDKLIHWLNPINQNNSIYIYRNTKFIPDRID